MEWNDTVLTRQSCRAYQQTQLTQEQLDAVLQAGCAAPIGKRRYEDVQLTVVQNQGLLEKIDENAAALLDRPGTHPLYGAPTLIFVSVKAAEGQIQPVAVANAACVMENMLLAAADQGLGSCYLWSPVQALNQNPQLLYGLQLQDDFWPVSAVALGVPAQPLVKRKAPQGTLRTNKIL